MRDVSDRVRQEQALREQAMRLARTTDDLRHANEELNHRQLELERAMSARSRFYASMSHELRTPINAVLGYSTLLLENIDQEENPRYYLTSVAEGFEIVRKVGNPHVKFLYDFYHEQISEGNLIKKLKENIDFVGLVHIADVPGRHQPGTGEINYASIYRKLAELKYSGYAAMEFIPEGDPVAALRSAREMVISAVNQ